MESNIIHGRCGVKLHKIAACLTILVFLLQSMLPSAFGQFSSNEGKTVTVIRVENNKAVSTDSILSKIKTHVGDVFKQDTLNEDLKRLYAMEYCTDVSIDVKDEAGGVAVTFVVEEKSVIEDIMFKGNKVFRAPKLKAAMKSKPNEMLNLATLAQDVGDIKDMYVKKGYPSVEVKYDIDVNKETNKALITVTVDEKTRVKVTKIDIAGNKAVKTDVIKKILTTKPAWLFNPGIYKEEVLQEDIEKIKSLYDDIGYLDAEITPKLDYAAEGTTLAITLEVTEGKQYMVGELVLKGNLVLQQKELMSKITMRSGKPFSNKTLRMDASSLKQLYYDYGYMNVTLDVDRQLDEGTERVNIAYTIDAKEPVYVGKIDIRGNTKTKEVVIRRELRIYPGDKFSGSKIKRSKERIYNLGFFENVSFDTEQTATPDIQSMVVTVKEGKTGEFSFGGGYSSIDMLLGFAEITQKNFDITNWPTFTGAGQSLAIKAEVGMVRNNFMLSWTDPWIFGYPYLLGFDAYNTTHNQRGDVGYAYDETRYGGDLRLGKEFTETFRGDLVYRLDNINISNVVDNASQAFKDEAGTNWISSLTLDLMQDTRDNIYNASRGYIVNGSITDAGGVLFGDKDFVKGTFGATYYHTFFEKVVMELKLRGGLAGAYGDSKTVPIYERFFAGGANTIRGYKERRVSPRDPGSNDPIGGNAIALANMEFTFPLYEKVLKGAVFYDVGNCWADASEFITGGDFRNGVGFGVRVKTPIGPVKVDWGYPLNGNYNDDKGMGEFYFSMSRGF